jgi:hypothetical protein
LFDLENVGSIGGAYLQNVVCFRIDSTVLSGNVEALYERVGFGSVAERDRLREKTSFVQYYVTSITNGQWQELDRPAFDV